MEFLQLAVLLFPMFILMGMGTPIFLAMGITCLISVLAFDLPFMILAKSYVRGLGHYGVLALPFYFLAGELMNRGGITKRLLTFSMALVGHIRGGLSHVNIVASMIFSGVSGSGAADVAAIGSVLIPAMKKEGYPAAYASAVTAASSTIGPIVPPSIPLVIYGLLTQVSIGKLFLAGAIPGILMGIYLLIASFIISVRRGYPHGKRATLRQLLRSSVDAGSALLMPIIILGGITSGIVTPTEAGVLAVAYGFILGIIFYREIRFRDLPDIMGQTMINTGSILIIIATTGLFAWIVANMGLGEVLVRVVSSASENKWVILGVLNLFFLIWGCFLEAVIAMFIIVPIFIPLITNLGIDPVHFGIVVVINLMIGAITPPVGIGIFLTSSMARARLEHVFRELIPFQVALLLVLVLCTYWPGMVMWLPNLLIK